MVNYENLKKKVRRILGKKVTGVIVFGSAARLEDFSPISDINLAIFTEKELTYREKLEVGQELGRRVLPLFLTKEDFKEFLERGDFLAHLLCNDSKVLICEDKELSNLVSSTPPLTEATKSYLLKHCIVSLAIAAENYLIGMYRDSLSYTYRSLRSAARFIVSNDRGYIPMNDSEVTKHLEEYGLSSLYNRLRDARFRGMRHEEIFNLIEETGESVAKLLGLKYTSLLTLLTKAREKRIILVERVYISIDKGKLSWRLNGLDPSGRILTIIT